MKKIYLVYILIFISYIITVDACSMIAPNIGIVIQDEATCNTYLDYIEDNNIPYSYDIHRIRLNACRDKSIILREGSRKEGNLSKFHELFLELGYSEVTISILHEELLSYDDYRSIEKQTDVQYDDFLKEVDAINKDICDCSKITIVNRLNGWTSYEYSFKDTCSFSPACYQPPFYCLKGNSMGALIFRKFIIPVLIAVSILLITIFVYKKIKKSGN